PQHEAEADNTGQIYFPVDDLKHIVLPGQIDNRTKPPITRSEILDFGNQGFLLHHVLSQAECDHFIKEGERVEFDKVKGARDDYREQQRISIESSELSEMLWERIRPWLSDITIEDDPLKQHVHGIKFLMQGTWTPIALNSVWRLGRYQPGGHFAPHFDGYFVRNSKERSLQTFMLYLNEGFEGGSTNFVDESQTLFRDWDGKYCAEEKNIVCGIKPEAGMAIVFNHQRLHEGQKLGSGVKYILRTDIMFRNLSQTSRSANEEKALQLVQEAERKEASGDCLEAAELYRKAFKLSSEVEAAYGT
ncbi:uncharacterized protein, partial [Littorina saxatilis]|uniref:uncharacterized protein n=1 Tax=Littorina saxatilis TaxID=31220 RepID=UPI0038B6A843